MEDKIEEAGDPACAYSDQCHADNTEARNNVRA